MRRNILLRSDLRDAVDAAVQHRNAVGWDAYDKEFDATLKKMQDGGATIIDYTAQQRNDWAKLVGPVW